MFHLLSLLASILTGLRATMAQVAPRGRARTPVVTPPWDHIDHMFACFERLYADWCHGTLPELRERADLPRAGVTRLSRPAVPDPDTTITAPRTPPPPPSPSPHPPLPAPCARPAGSSASPCCPRNARPAISRNPAHPACQRTLNLLRFSNNTPAGHPTHNEKRAGSRPPARLSSGESPISSSATPCRAPGRYPGRTRYAASRHRHSCCAPRCSRGSRARSRRLPC